MRCDASVGGVGVDNRGLQEGADRFELRVEGPQEIRFGGLKEGETDGPGAGEGVELG